VRGGSVELPLKRGEYAAFIEKMTAPELQAV